MYKRKYLYSKEKKKKLSFRLFRWKCQLNPPTQKSNFVNFILFSSAVADFNEIKAWD